MFKLPPAKKLRVLMRKIVTVKRYQLEGEEDAYGQKYQANPKVYQVKAEIQEVIAEDERFMVPGKVEIGDAWGYFLPRYEVLGEEFIINKSDEVSWAGKTWIVDQVESYTFGNKEWYKRVLLKRKPP